MQDYEKMPFEEERDAKELFEEDGDDSIPCVDSTPQDLEQIILGVELDTEELQGAKYDEAEFKKGLKEYSYIAGAYVALSNAGISMVEAMNYILNFKIL